MLKKQISINSIFKFLKVNNDKVENKNEKITKFVPFDSATKNNITFLNDHDKKAVLKLKSSKASLIICSSKLEKKMKNHKNMIFVENPRLEFIRCLNEFFPKLKNDGIDSSSIIKTKEISLIEKVDECRVIHKFFSTDQLGLSLTELILFK